MARFIVKVLRVQGINNKTYVAGEAVYDYNFPEGNAQKLVAEGKLVSDESKAELKAKAKKEAEEQAKKEAEEQAKKEEEN
jgi:hypothetical protein